MKHDDDIEQKIAGFFGQSSMKRVTAYLLVTLIVAFSGASFFEAVLVGLKPSWEVLAGLGVLSLLVVVGGAYGLTVALRNWDVVERLRRGPAEGKEFIIGKDIDVLPRHGLVVFVSDKTHTKGTNESAEFKAISHHTKELRDCWLVHSAVDRSKKNAESVSKEFPEIRFHLTLLDEAYDVHSSFDTTTAIFETALQNGSGPALSRHDLIVDITGGTKPMTAGALLACIQWGIDLQYQEPGNGSVHRSSIRSVDVNWFPELSGSLSPGRSDATHESAS